ncbi:SDR family NAD(P)-dependent oxidoreductase [Patulibacter minatonensis]|uniref:SDR family NAD(P)-dependent oxidoreductase n=1 Tax=Patulibacter minatonensis TaxID=298163 RepID=UPI00047CFECC|nr:SDR family NAD(P)-dependent oxidoreductase [Patulibacter minatonensis]
MTTTGTALVTGANKGIGLAVATELGRRGFAVGVGARDAGRRDDAVRRLRDGGIEAFAVPLDVTDDASVGSAAGLLEQRGGLDVLVNNAGVSGGLPQDPGEAGAEVLRSVFETNVLGLVRVTDAVLPLLRASSRARIVNVSSTMGSIAAMAHAGERMPVMVAYSPSKAAVNALTVLYAQQLREAAVLVNAACPGYVATDFTGHPAGARTPEQGAAVVVRLATLPDDGPTGTFTDDDGPIAW